MSKIFQLIILSLLLFTSVSVLADTNDLYPFENPTDQQRFTFLLKEFRCLVCQNQNLLDSNAPLANDLRRVIYQQVRDHKTNVEIKEYLVARYGDFVLFRPPFKATTWVLWSSPLLLLLIGVGIWMMVLRRNKQ